MWADPAVTRFIGGRVFNREEVWARLLRYAGHWQWMGYGFWAIEEKESGRKRRYYQITDKGRAALSEKVQSWNALCKAVNSILEKSNGQT